MEISTTKCCAIMEIHNLGSHATPEAAMVEFCKLTIVSQPVFGTARNVPLTGSMYAFYLFTAACNSSGGPLRGYTRAYGKEFSEFIKEKELGKIWASPVKRNEVFHTDHCNQVWVWDVDNTALRAWWTAYQKGKKKELI